MTELLATNKNYTNSDTETETLEEARARIVRQAIAARTIDLVTTRAEITLSVMPEEFTD